MNEVSDVMRNILDKCRISIEGKTFSREMLVRAYAEFLSRTIEAKKHNVSVVLHPGSICFDALIITYAAVSNLVFNQTRVDDIVESLSPGDIVVYGGLKKERYTYEGIAEGDNIRKEDRGRIKLMQDNGSVRYVHQTQWRLIEPYNGKARKLDGRGIRRKGTQREDFLKDVLGMEKADIFSIVDTSTVLVMTKEEADLLIKGISISFGKKEAKLLDLVTVSYFTEDDEHSYGGNTSKNEPVLKICSKVSVARKLILSRDGNRHIGLIVLGLDRINRGESELPELVNRKSLQYVYISANEESEFVYTLLDEDTDENINIFACTKEFLNENASVNVVEENSLTEELQKKIEVIKEQKNELIVLNSPTIDLDKTRLFRKTLLMIKRNQYESDSKDIFIIQAYSLFNLLMTAPFSVGDLDRCVKSGLISVETIDDKINRLELLANEIGASLKAEAIHIISILKEMKVGMQESSEKETWLFNFIRRNYDKTIAIVIPKAYYATIIKEKQGYLPSYLRKVLFMTPGRFDNARLYDVVIVMGDYEGKKFNVFKCRASKNIISVLYKSEEKSYYQKKKKEAHDTKRWNKRSTIHIDRDAEDEEIKDDLTEDSLIEEQELDNYISNLDTVIVPTDISLHSQGGKNNLNTEIIAVATFSDDSKAFFSKHYKAYVLDSGDGTVKEVGVPDLREGDAVIFTKNNNDTKDIVDSVLRKMLDDGKLQPTIMEAYEKSKEWQKCLIAYMQENRIEPRRIAEEMLKLNAPVQEPTIIRWLDEDAHTVGPREIDSFRAIGNLTGNTELMNNPDSFFEACREIRSVRRRILGEIGNAIINQFSGRKVTENKNLSEVYKNLDSLAEVLEIERIIPTERVWPLYAANRPISI